MYITCQYISKNLFFLFKRYLFMRKVYFRYEFLFNEFVSQYMQNSISILENMELVIWTRKLLTYIAEILYFSLIFDQILKISEKDKFIEILGGQIVNQYNALNVFSDCLINHIKEQTISVKVSIDPLKSIINKLEDQFSKLNEIIPKEFILHCQFKKEFSKIFVFSKNILLVNLKNNDTNNEKIEKVINKFKDILDKIQISIIKFFIKFLCIFIIIIIFFFKI